MADVVTPEQRSRMMSGIRGKNTRPELMVRKGLHALGFRYRMHDKKLPGIPDIVFPVYRAVILVHGCFWHAHGCHLFKWPSSRKEFWKEKITRNVQRDKETLDALEKAGWRILIIWECALKGRTRLPTASAIESAAKWLKTGTGNYEIKGDE